MKPTNNPGDLPNPARGGFATFFKEDGQYYFQLNDKTGRPIFHSHGYQSERSRDNGIQAVIRNAAEKENYEPQQSKKGRHFFLLKSGNNQEIGRSVSFDSKSEMEEKLDLMMGVTEETPVFELIPPATEKPEGAETEAMAEPAEEASAKELPIENMPRYKFSIIYYPDSGLWNIKHDQSGNTRQLKTCDGKQIEAFLKAHLPLEKVKAALAAEPVIAHPKAPSQEGIPRKEDQSAEEEIELKIRSIQGKEVQHLAGDRNLGQIEALPKRRTTVSSDVYEARVVAKSLESDETVVVSEVKGRKPAYGRFVIPIFEANKLRPGMYRFMVNIHQGEEGKEEHDYSGSRLVMLN